MTDSSMREEELRERILPLLQLASEYGRSDLSDEAALALVQAADGRCDLLARALHILQKDLSRSARRSQAELCERALEICLQG